VDAITEIRLKSESKKTVRYPTAKVNITWAGRGADEAIATANTNNRGSAPRQTVYGIGIQKKWMFAATINGSESFCTLDGTFCAMPEISEDGLSASGYLIGWRGADISGSAGAFANAQTIVVSFPHMTVFGFILNGDTPMGEYPVDFTVTAKSDGVTIKTVYVTGNTSVAYLGNFGVNLQNVNALEFKITRWNKAGGFVKITAAYDKFTAERDGSDIVDMAVLEEADGAVGTLPFGNVSANELTLSLQNIDDKYFRGNTTSAYNNLAMAGRRVEPFLGFKIDGDAGDTLYAPKGVFWTGDWNIPESGTTASTTALDRLGMLQDVEYNGIGGFNTVDDVAARSHWDGENLYDILSDVLGDLRMSYGPMMDLEYDIDQELRTVTIPLAYFERQSYFDVIRTVAEAGSAYAFMDNPTEAEKAIAADRGNTDCADILRVKRINNFWSSDRLEIIVNAEKITQRDYVEKNPMMRRDDVVNVVSVPYCEYVVGDDGTPEAAGDTMVIVRGVESSIMEYGRREYEVSENKLVQTQEQAAELADGILSIFSGAPVTAEINTYGDVTRAVGDIIIVPEYQKRGIDKAAYYAVTRINTEYGDGMRQSITCRRLGDYE